MLFCVPVFSMIMWVGWAGVSVGMCGGKRPSLLFVCSEVFLPFVHASSSGSSQEGVDV